MKNKASDCLSDQWFCQISDFQSGFLRHHLSYCVCLNLYWVTKNHYLKNIVGNTLVLAVMHVLEGLVAHYLIVNL